MKEQQFNELDRGDLIKHKNNSAIYIVTSNYGGRVTAVKTVDITDPGEWKLLLKANYET